MKRIDLGDGWLVELTSFLPDSLDSEGEYHQADLLRRHPDSDLYRAGVSFTLRENPGDPMQTAFLDKLEEAIGVIRREAGEPQLEAAEDDEPRDASEELSLGFSAVAALIRGLEADIRQVNESVAELQAYVQPPGHAETLQERLDRRLLSYHEVYNGLASRVTALEGREERTADEPYWQTLRRRFSANEVGTQWGHGYRQARWRSWKRSGTVSRRSIFDRSGCCYRTLGRYWKAPALTR